MCWSTSTQIAGVCFKESIDVDDKIKINVLRTKQMCNKLTYNKEAHQRQLRYTLMLKCSVGMKIFILKDKLLLKIISL